MKPLYLFLSLICAVALNSCNKDTQSPKQVYGKVLPGVWELRAVFGGMLAYDPNTNNYKPGNGDLWAFTPTGFARLYKDSVYSSGTYSISRGTGADFYTSRKIDQFVFNNEPALSFELKNDTLEFFYGPIALDGGSAQYVKIAEDTTTNAGH